MFLPSYKKKLPTLPCPGEPAPVCIWLLLLNHWDRQETSWTTRKSQIFRSVYGESVKSDVRFRWRRENWQLRPHKWVKIISTHVLWWCPRSNCVIFIRQQSCQNDIGEVILMASSTVHSNDAFFSHWLINTQNRYLFGTSRGEFNWLSIHHSNFSKLSL